jgi:hypothetical protein
MSTFDVLRRAAAAGKNLVITHEPTFYNDRDLVADLESDPVYLSKQRFIAEHDLVVWRFHDHAHAMRPDPLVAGSARALGWTPYASPTEPRIYVLRRPRLGAGDGRREAARRSRDQDRRRSHDESDAGEYGPGYGIPALAPPSTCRLAVRSARSGQQPNTCSTRPRPDSRKAMIALGHMMSEDHGMQEVAGGSARSVRSTDRVHPGRRPASSAGVTCPLSACPSSCRGAGARHHLRSDAQLVAVGSWIGAVTRSTPRYVPFLLPKSSSTVPSADSSRA